MYIGYIYINYMEGVRRQYNLPFYLTRRDHLVLIRPLSLPVEAFREARSGLQHRSTAA
jgi:hypothetical protein